MESGRRLLRILTTLILAGLIVGLPVSRTSAAPHAGLIFIEEGFEEDWPSENFVVIDDSDADGGEYLWGARDCNPRTGDFAIWGTGAGEAGAALLCTSLYPANASTWVTFAPLDLTGAKTAKLVFYLRGESEYNESCDLDYLFVGATLDPEGEYAGDRFCGSWMNGEDGNGYTRRELDLSRYLDNDAVYLALNFESNETNHYQGYTIDDVMIVATSPLYPGSDIYIPVISRSQSQ